MLPFSHGEIPCEVGFGPTGVSGCGPGLIESHMYVSTMKSGGDSSSSSGSSWWGGGVLSLMTSGSRRRRPKPRLREHPEHPERPQISHTSTTKTTTTTTTTSYFYQSQRRRRGGGDHNRTLLLFVLLLLILCTNHLSLACYVYPPDIPDPCKEKVCQFGAQCVPSLGQNSMAICQCPHRCDTYGDNVGGKPICGDDGVDYPNKCEMRRASCNQMKDIKMKYFGKCGE